MEDLGNIKALRRDIFLAAYSGGIGHLASAYSITEILYALYFKDILKYDAQKPDWSGRDRLILSKGHGSLALYSVLSQLEFFPREALWTFTKPGSFLGGEPNPSEVPGVEAATGSLGHGLSLGVGMALAYKLDDLSNHTYVIVGDGESQEGSIWEAAMSAVALELDNLTVIVDENQIQKMDFVDKIMKINSWESRWRAFGFDTIVVDGHNLDELTAAFKRVNATGKPKAIIARTVKGKGVSLMENNPSWHYRMPKKKELKVFMDELDITEERLAKCKELL